MESVGRPSIHFLLLSPFRGCGWGGGGGCWSLSQLTLGMRRGTPWMSLPIHRRVLLETKEMNYFNLELRQIHFLFVNLQHKIFYFNHLFYHV